MRATCHVANTRVYLGFDTKGSRLRNFSFLPLFIGDDTKYWIFLNGQFPFSFILFFVFLKQFFWDSWWKMKIADDWIWTADLWRLKQLLYQLRHNHCPLLCTGICSPDSCETKWTHVMGIFDNLGLQSGFNHYHRLTGIASKVIRQSREWYFYFFKSVDYSWIFLHVPALEVLFTSQITGFRNSEHWP